MTTEGRTRMQLEDATPLVLGEDDASTVGLRPGTLVGGTRALRLVYERR